MYNLDKRKLLIIKHLINHKQHISSETLASVIGSNSRTVRDDLKVIDSFLQNFGAGIVAKAGLGYRICFEDFNEYQIFVQVFREKYNDDSMIPTYSKERIDTVLRILLTQDWVKTSALTEILYISKTTFNRDMKAVRTLLEQYHIELIHKPGYGFQMKGEEHHIRVLLSDYLYGDEEDSEDTLDALQYCLDNKVIQDTLVSCFRDLSIHVGANSFYEIVNYILASAIRYEDGHKVAITVELEEEAKTMPEYTDLSERLHKLWSRAPETELCVLILYIQARRIYGIDDVFNRRTNTNLYEFFGNIKNYIANCTNSNIIMDRDLEELIPRILKGLLLRVKLGFESRNMQSINIKQKNEAYDLAALICYYIGKEYQLSVPVSEIVHLAKELQEPLVKAIHEATMLKIDVCMVSSTGKNGGLIYCKALWQNYGGYIKSLVQKEFYEINEGENDFDILVTDMPKLKFNISEPVFQIKYGLNEREGRHFRSVISLKKERARQFCTCFSPDLLFMDMNSGTKEELVYEIVSKMKEKDESNTLYEMCMFQDSFSSAERGNNVAVCHSFWAVSEEPRIAAVILKRPLLWEKELVTIVFVAALGKKEKYLYSCAANLSALITDIDLVHELHHVKNYEQFILLIKEAFEKNELL